jgi:hypothetical protein
MSPAEDDVDDDGSASSEDSEFEEGSSYSVSIFSLYFGIQLGPMQAEATHPTEKKAIRRTLSCQVPSFG